MRLNCEILIANRVSCSLNMRNAIKPTRASVAVGRKESSKSDFGEKEKTVFLLVCTAKERNGTKYKVTGNLMQIFTKFMDNGKATIRLKEPPHDLLISKADPSNLKALLSILKLGDKDLQKANLSCLVPAKASEIEKSKTELLITKRKDYPIGKPFPNTLQKLTVAGCALVRVDLRVLQLQHLTSLSLPNNQIKELPFKMSKLSTLRELILRGNVIKEFPSALCNGPLASCLRFLDLSQNQIKLLPLGFYNFKNLVHLRLDENELYMLPINIGNIASLRFLSASQNQLAVLPGSILSLKLESVNVSGNPFLCQDKWNIINKLSVPSLKECAGITLKRHRCHYSNHCIPASLAVFLDTAKQCLCGNYCFGSCIHHIVPVDLQQLSNTVVLTGSFQSHLPTENFLCSVGCLNRLLSSKRQYGREILLELEG